MGRASESKTRGAHVQSKWAGFRYTHTYIIIYIYATESAREVPSVAVFDGLRVQSVTAVTVTKTVTGGRSRALPSVADPQPVAVN
jgi:hypothetical protein